MISILHRYATNPSLFIKDWQNKVRLSLTANPRGTTFEGNNRIYPLANVARSYIGRGSYIGPRTQLPLCRVGRYCSIGPDVHILGGTHPTHLPSTHPAFYSTRKQAGFSYVNENLFDEYTYADTDKKFYVEIGSDVWLGARSTILGGVTIASGAVVAAGSVVTSNVEPYAIVAGAPARMLKLRFPKPICEALLSEPWWDNDEAWVLRHASLMRNIDALSSTLQHR